MKSAERRLQVLDVARDIIRREGIAALTMSRLADAAGVAKPVIYKHFESAEAVAVEVLAEYFRASKAFCSRRLEGAETIFAYFDRLIDALFDHVAAEGPLIRNITNGFVASGRVDGQYLKDQAQSLAAYRAVLLQQGIPEKRARIAAHALMEMINLTVLEFATDHDAQDRDVLKRMVDAALRALVPGDGVKPQVPAAILAAP